MRFFTHKVSIAFTVCVVSHVLFSCGSRQLLRSKYPNKLFVVTSDTIESFMVASASSIEPSLDKRYYFYTRSAISSAMGTFIGKPLDGPYVMSTRDNKIIKRGQFINGLKDGRWATWYSNGNIATLENWKGGSKQGTFSEYYEDGKLKRKGKYRRDKLSGKVYYYDLEGREQRLTYTDGQERVEQQRDTSKSAHRIRRPLRKVRKKDDSLRAPTPASTPTAVKTQPDNTGGQGRKKKEKVSSDEGSQNQKKKKKSLTGGAQPINQ